MNLENAKHKGMTFSLRITDPFEANDINLVLHTGKTDRTVKPWVKKDGNILILRYTFERTGLYDVHLQVNNEIVATYVVQVKRN